MSSSAEKIRRPPAITAASATIPDEVSPWTSLPVDLVQLVGWQVLARDLLDYIRFRAACTHWRSSTVCPHGRGIVDPRFHPRRWMILSEGHGLHPGDGKKRFFSSSTGSFVRVRLPLLADHRILESVDGLLLLQPNRRAKKAMILLLHPFTGDIVKLPPLMPLLESYWALIPDLRQYCLVDLNFVASLSVSAYGKPVLMIVHQNIPRVLFATTDDQQWRVSTWNLPPFSQPISFQGKLYILEYSPTSRSSGRPILRLDPPRHEHAVTPSSLPPPTLIATCPAENAHGSFSLAECDSEILLIGSDDKPIGTSRLVVYRLADLVIGKVIPVKSIGGNSVFLDIRTSTTSIQEDGIFISKSMTSSYRMMPTVAGDTIVWKLHNYFPRQYHLATRKWSQIMGGCVGYNTSGGCNCGLIYHIYGCCHCTDEQESWYCFKL